MKVFFSNDQNLHAPKWYLADGTVRPCPEVPARADILHQALAAAGTELIAADSADPFPAIRKIHNADYLAYLENIHTAWTEEFGKDASEYILPDTFPARRPALIPAKPSAQTGYYCFDMAAPIGPHTFRAAVASARCAVAAANSLLAGQRAAYALCRPPGHHAGPDYCGGFCFLNNAAVAAQHLLLNGNSRIALLDIDYHHGNGTQDIFYHRNDVLFVSIHADPNTQYPYFWGHAAETGSGPGEGFNINLSVPGAPANPRGSKPLPSRLPKSPPTARTR